MFVVLRRVCGPALAALVLLATGPAVALSAGEVNVYSHRQEFLIRPLLDRFTEETGIEVNVVFAKKGMIERLKAEGRHSPADVVLSVDVARLNALSEAGLLRPLRSQVLARNVPAAYRHPDGLWYALTLRARVIFYAKDRVDPSAVRRYEDLTDPQWRGRICMRSAKHPYNLALLSSIVSANGTGKAEAWVRGLQANLARRPLGNDRSQIKAIKAGICDLAIGNSYYYGVMKFNERDQSQREAAEAVGLIFPNQATGDRGTHVNITGVALTRSAKRVKQARALIEFLIGTEAQGMYASKNYEYPVRPDVAPDKEVASWGAFRPDTASLNAIAKGAPRALRMFDRARFE